MYIITLLFQLVIILNMFFVVIVIFRERRDVGSSWAWLLVLIFIPLLGFVLYLLFGQNLRRYHLFQWEGRKKVRSEKILGTQLVQLRNRQFQFHNQVIKDNSDLIYMHLVNGVVLTEDNSVGLFTDGQEKFDMLFKDIEGAKNHIHLQYYIIKNDQLGKKLIEVLAKKAKEGVQVRVLYDDLGSRRLTKRFFKKLRESGGVVEAFFPSRFRLINLRINYRNHRKVVIIDGKIGYVGGFNVGNEYLGKNQKFGYWRDTHLRIQGTAVHSLQTRFILDWNQASHSQNIIYKSEYFPEVTFQGNVGIQIVSSGPDSEWEHIKNGFIKMISLAKKSILIQTPYFIPDTSLLDSLRIACFSGVEVKIMIPNKPDHICVYWATLSYIGELLKAGANVYIYDNGFIHAKTIIIDEKISSVGTANIDVRSFKLDFEVNAFLYDEGFAHRLTNTFQKDVKVSRQLTLNEYAQFPLRIRFKESIARLLSPLL
ncbi:cardiolipin synthase [Chengkuizengella sp. SCS-71B]|uniref:cardiolipin synthase n=1 Tax=Chengkuizengella sp. SCS-71B TaxID=3115290 RepID=UPI0032C2435D